MANYKQLSQELYEVLKEIRDVIKKFEVPPVLDYKVERIDKTLQKYENVITRRKGRTTALYMKAIAEALENPGNKVEFVDHSPYDFSGALLHKSSLELIVDKLGYNIAVLIHCRADGEQSRVVLINKFRNE